MKTEPRLSKRNNKMDKDPDSRVIRPFLDILGESEFLIYQEIEKFLLNKKNDPHLKSSFKILLEDSIHDIFNHSKKSILELL